MFLLIYIFCDKIGHECLAKVGNNVELEWSYENNVQNN